MKPIKLADLINEDVARSWRYGPRNDRYRIANDLWTKVAENKYVTDASDIKAAGGSDKVRLPGGLNALFLSVIKNWKIRRERGDDIISWETEWRGLHLTIFND